jgi:plastocyanin
MIRRARGVGLGALGCGVCVLAASSALAAWSPATPRNRGGEHHPSSRCAAKAHTRRHTARKRCASIRRNAVHPRVAPSAAPAPGGLGGAGVGASPSAPVNSPTSTQPSEDEASTPPPSVPEVQVTAVEYHFTLSRTTVPAGKVILEFVNNGQDEHNLNALPSSGPLAATFSNAASKSVSHQVVELRPGAYTLFCSLAGHEQKGMKATLVVE